jgi:hypothetical protein
VAAKQNQINISEALHRLNVLIGSWNISGTMETGETVMLVSGRWSFSPVADGQGLSLTGQTAIEGLGSFAEAELIAVDPVDGLVHLFAVNKFVVRDHIGGWTDERTLYVEYRGNQDGKECREGITMAFNPQRIEAKVLETLAGQTVVITNLTMLKEA